MYLRNIKLWNFRKFGSDDECDYQTNAHLNLNLTKGLNVIIGENDSGKTAIVDAIKLVLKTHSYEFIRVEERDFYKNATRFKIELNFIDLSPDEAKNFTEWLSWYEKNGIHKPYLKLIYDVSRESNRIFPSDVKAGSDDEGYLMPSEAKDYLKATYLKPLRDAENELIAKRNSRLSQILLGDESFSGKENDNELLQIFEILKGELEKFFNEVDEKGQAKSGKQIKDKIDVYIKNFYGQDKETEFEATSNDIKSILEKLTLSLKEEPNPGLGTLNRLFMAAELLHLNKSNWSGLRLGLVEELEAHLHPQAQMQVIEAFQKYDDIQLVFTTHSPNLASKLKLKNLIFCNNGGAFPMGASYTKLHKDNYKFLEKFLDTTKANLFFAKGLILVEGWAEEILLPSIANAIGINLTEKGVSIVNIGHTGFDHYANVFLRQREPNMIIPVAVITDSDVWTYNKNGDNYIKRNSQTVQQETDAKLITLNNKSELNVQYFPAPNWTLEFSLFKSASLTTEFQNAVKKVHTRTNWTTDFEGRLAEKLINKGLKKTEIAYHLANSIDEDIKKEIPSIQNIALSSDTVNYLVKAIEYASRV